MIYSEPPVIISWIPIPKLLSHLVNYFDHGGDVAQMQNNLQVSLNTDTSFLHARLCIFSVNTNNKTAILLFAIQILRIKERMRKKVKQRKSKENENKKIEKREEVQKQKENASQKVISFLFRFPEESLQTRGYN
jgi:hypothetical protein